MGCQYTHTQHLRDYNSSSGMASPRHLDCHVCMQLSVVSKTSCPQRKGVQLRYPRYDLQACEGLPVYDSPRPGYRGRREMLGVVGRFLRVGAGTNSLQLGPLRVVSTVRANNLPNTQRSLRTAAVHDHKIHGATRKIKITRSRYR